MQPFSINYYWQLIYHVDKFLILDDVNFIKQIYSQKLVPHTGSLIQITIKGKKNLVLKKLMKLKS